MKRTLFGLGCSIALSAMPAVAQDSVPAATLGRPAASLGRPVLPTASPSWDVRPATAIDFVPKNMPKGSVSEATPTLPMPTPGTPLPGSVVAPSITGPVFVGPGAPTTLSGPIPGVPVMVQPPGVAGPIVGTPMPGCDSPYGCGVPGVTGGCGVPGVVGGCGMPVPMSRWYVSAEYMMWWLKGYTAPDLVTVGPVASQGILGQAGVTSIFPTEPVNNNPVSGFRGGLGYWFSPKWAVETSFFFVRDDQDTFTATSTQFPNSILARPFFSLNQNTEFVEQIGNPGIYAGGIDIQYKTALWGLDINLRKHLYQSCACSFDLLFGVRMLDLGEELTITEYTTGLAGAPRQFIGQSRVLTDSFKTENQFYGGQIGAAYEHHWGRWSLNAQAKLALGCSVMTSTISGGIAPGGGFAPNQPGGLLALSSNIGSVTETKLAFVPEFNLNLGYDLTSHTRLFVGYSFLYWSTVARPGSQIDRNLDEYRIPDFTLGRNPPVVSNPRPLNVVQREEFWAQGLSIGLQFRW